jgi:peptidoglycan hydrolase-like protein with peptidoglycan-binding domain
VSVYRGFIGSVAGVGVSAEPFPGVILTLGSSGTDVEAVQTYLGVIAEVYTEIIPPEVSGDYDVATENAVRTLQGLFGLPQSGVVGPITWELIAEKYSEIENGKLRAEFQYPGDTIS